MRCWFCLEERPPGDEHIFPRAIGGTLRTSRVCTSCNSLLGAKVDAPLTDHIFIAAKRSILRLAGNSGKAPDGVKLMLGSGVLASDPSVRMRLATNPKTGKIEACTLYSASDITLDDGTVQRRIIVDGKDAGKLGIILQRERKRAGLPPLDEEKLARQVTGVAASVQATENPTINFKVPIDLSAFHRGIFKIAYELACLWLGDAYLDDSTAATLRDVVLGRKEGENAGLRGTVKFGTDIAPLRFWAEDRDCHLAFNSVVDGRMAIILRVFDNFSAVVFLTETAERYAAGRFDPHVLRFVHIDPVAGTMRHSSFMDEVGRLGGRGRNPLIPATGDPGH